MTYAIAGFVSSSRAALQCGATALALVATPALAQNGDEAQPAGDLPSESYDGNEIVVTATKREQTLQDVPVAVTVTTAQTIERAHIRDIKDLANVVPSLRVGERQNSANTNFFIRGFGNGANNAGIEPSVGVFVDGVYRSRSASQITDLPDIERIEVLRGPQSTLFGKNASAGVISIVTQKPKFTFGGNVEASYGNYDAWVIKGVVTGPVSDTVALSVAGSLNRRDGWARNAVTGTDTNDRNRWFLRGQALFESDSGLRVRLIGDYGKIDEICCAVVNVLTGARTGVLTSPPINGRVNAPADAFADTIYTNFDSTNHIKNYGISGQVDYELGPLKLTSITAWRRSLTDAHFDSDYTSADLLRGSNLGHVDLKTFTQEFRATASIANKLDILLGGFYFNEKVNQGTHLAWGVNARTYADVLVRGLSNNALSVPGLETLFGQLSGQNYTGRFFAAGPTLDEIYDMKNENYSLFSQVDFHVSDRLTLTGGIAYTNDKKRYTTNVRSSDTFSKLDLAALRNAATNAGIAQQVGLIVNGGALATPQQIALFAQANPATFAAIQTGAANATAPLLGLRQLQFFPDFLNVPNAVEPGRTADHKFTYTARVAYDLTDTVNVYASYATGYKASSINLSRDSRPSTADQAAIQAAGLAFPNLTYDVNGRSARPENSEVYEAGLKGNWGLVTANLAVFYQAIKGFQSNIFTGTGFVLANAGKESVFGIEFEGTARPAKGVLLGLSLTYLDPKYDDFKNSAFGDATGIRPADIPAISATFTGEYDHEMPNGDHVILHGSYHYESEVQVVEGLPGFINVNGNGNADGIAAARQFTREVDELDASLTYAMRNGLELSVWGRNLLNDRYVSTVFDAPAQKGTVAAYPNQPRTYGVSARFRW